MPNILPFTAAFEIWEFLSPSAHASDRTREGEVATAGRRDGRRVPVSVCVILHRSPVCVLWLAAVRYCLPPAGDEYRRNCTAEVSLRPAFSGLLRSPGTSGGWTLVRLAIGDPAAW